MKKILRKLLNQLRRKANPLQFSGFSEGRIESGAIEFLSDEELSRLNELLPWMCFTADSKGRRFGDMAWASKRDVPQHIPDERIVELDRLFGLGTKSVLEVGCFEGVHTIALAQLCPNVYAIDSRVENVVKTIVRTNFFGQKPTVNVCDLENEADFARLPKVDVLHHVGVLYHIKDPVAHLLRLGSIVREGLLLDTHYATEDMTNAELERNGCKFRYFKYAEGGRDEVFSGMYDHAKWLLREDIFGILQSMGFSDLRMHRDELQRNGPRMTLFASKPGVMKT